MAQAQQAAEFVELRRARRMRTYVAGKIVFRDASCSVNCVVRDVSDTGARIAVAADRLLPERCYFVASKRESVFDAEIVWQRGDQRGLRLLPVLDLSEPRLQFLKNIADELRARP